MGRKSLNIETMRLNEKLRKLCAERGVTNRKLADIVNASAEKPVSASTAGRWLTDQAVPSLREGYILSRHFGVPIEFLADDEADEPEPGLSEDQREILRIAARLGPERAINRLINMDDRDSPQDVVEYGFDRVPEPAVIAKR